MERYAATDLVRLLCRDIVSSVSAEGRTANQDFRLSGNIVLPVRQSILSKKEKVDNELKSERGSRPIRMAR